MELETAFWQRGNQEGYWEPQRNILLAVSTGVDSMVLLDLMEKVSQKIDCTIAVAHINHQLREASQQEEKFLQDYCQKKGIPCYVRRWENPPIAGMENAARQFRYDFFRQLMQTYYFDTLMTAHHSDDQLETMLMKMMREGNLKSAAGIRPSQSFAGGKLIRPLLSFSKEEIQTYAQQKKIFYYEDETNSSLDMQRNRLRHQVVPLLKKENPQILPHFQQLSQQLLWAEDWVTQQQKAWFETAVHREADWQFALPDFLANAPAQRYFYLQYFFMESRKQLGIGASEEQLMKILQQLNSEKAQWTLDFEEDWQVIKTYDRFSLQRNQSQEALKCHEMRLGESLFLSENEWLALWRSDQPGKIPKKVKFWSEFSQVLPVDFSTMVTIRKRKAGDRIQLTPALQKKVSRVFIDKKIPNEQRERAWLVEDEEQRIVAILPVLFSYLSIAEETDKIHYRLLYKYRK
ncbi:tRNA lysidine(34) synthetase TilS [Enterococcus songbeiensis]|uniref:tRNA lysidine(34) synthetase TilS n=1 Tax=Enterococcus songbeiensis TaxID=2559927 RepID=UPI0010F8F56F|nr:tRNA lysidine(34) synthetase TilS [Enterococcus songbeiensis]